MSESLSVYLKNNRPQGFTSRPQYCQDGDYLTYFLSNDLYYAQRIGDSLTVYISETTGEMIGCKLKGVKLLRDRMGDFAFSVTDGKRVLLGPLVVTAAMISEEDHRKQYIEVAKRIGTAEVDLTAISAAA